MEQLEWSGWAALAACALLVGISKTGLPGVGMLATLLAATVIPAKQSTGLILPMLIAGDFFAVAYYRRHAVWKHLVKLIPFAAAGVVLGWLAMKRMNDAQLSIFIGSVILVLLALSWWRTSRGGEVPIPSGWWFPVVMGLAAGVTTMMANAAGPIMIIYLLAMRLPKDEFLGTGAWYYLIINWFKVPFSAERNLINWPSLQLNLALAPAVLAGAAAGIWLIKRIPQKAFTAVIQVIAALLAAWLIVNPFVMK
jgi:hypothetical protein